MLIELSASDLKEAVSQWWNRKVSSSHDQIVVGKVSIGEDGTTVINTDAVVES